MDEQTQKALVSWLTLQQIKGLGLKRLHALLDEGLSPESILVLSQDKLDTLPSSIRTDLNTLQNKKAQHPYVQHALRQLDLAEKEGWQLLALDQDEYPALLKEIPFAPPILYVKGHIKALHSMQLAIVGARKASQMALTLTRDWSQAIARQSVSITSGLALGIDAAAHRGALDVSGITLAVLAHGLDQVYPRSHQKLADEIVEQGALITEFPRGTAVKRDHFPRRNRIVSGLSQGVLVVEAAVKSGSLITAQYAVEQNRDVFAVPGSIANPMAKGCHLLIKQGAALVESADDIIAQLDLLPVAYEVKESIQKTTSIDAESNLLDQIPFEFIHFDELVEIVNLPAHTLMVELGQLALSQHIEEQSGAYRRIK